MNEWMKEGSADESIMTRNIKLKTTEKVKRQNCTPAYLRRVGGSLVHNLNPILIKLSRLENNM